MSHPDEPGMLELKEPPHSLEAEQSVLGALLCDAGSFDRIPFLREEHFYRHDHRLIFGALQSLIERGHGADMILVSERLKDQETLEKAGGFAYLGALAQNVPGVSGIVRYAELVRNKAILRQIIQHAQDLQEKAFSGAVEANDLADEAGAAFLGIQLDEGSEPVDIGHAVIEAVEVADNPVHGVPSGYQALDTRLGGLMPGDLVIIAGRPSMGKTALAMNIAEHVAAKQQVLVFSLEMTRAKLAGRMLRYHQRQLGSRDEAVDHLSRLHMTIDHSASIGLGHLRLRARRLKRTKGLALIVVDYLQLIVAKAENRTQEVSAVSRGLKAIAKELEVPIIAVAQLNRAVEGRADNRPVLADLRESGQIEQDADVIAFVYRDEYYRPETPWKGIAEVIFRKFRDGAVGTDHLDFIPELTRFRTREMPLPQPEATDNPKVRNFSDFKSKAAGDTT